jgi:hypothetical protein
MAQNIKKFSAFIKEDMPPPIAPPTNIADGSKIAGLPPDLPPVPQRRNKSKIGRRKPPVA